ncbi:trypsin-like peptidase domain-containing protein [Luteolibacter pohnpeiensis]|uniref:Trypsin-like peptidase domain-containing protein n=1 Tax=Luteolibacter pohnpeiensis TaxID=454153 RepID=A0A934S2R6_9BACT|nr:trypsin-like peptidase domain-containing protein [Luteolibacter pohnpeiensis]MBK1880813.1 trypsin-like peptidase domain-containing protein [Luteolibacter pohnpeiensis]
MNSGLRRLLSLAAVFLVAFVAVYSLRVWRRGGSFRDLIPGLSKHEEKFSPEKYTLPDSAPIDLSDVQLLARLNNEYARLTQAVVPSVVSITTSGERDQAMRDAWGRTAIRPVPVQGQGSGVIVTEEGHVVTNHHVIAGQDRITITLHNGKEYRAKLIGEDNLLDIAVLKIDSDEKFTPLKLGDSSKTQVGEIVFAVGNPFGLSETVTQGIISAKERSFADDQRNLFQTDAAINPGNSGGPLVNLRGEVIGINVRIVSADRQNPASAGLGFSLPSNDIKDAIVQILERGRPIRGYLGIQVGELTPYGHVLLNYTAKGGIAVRRVTDNSPAQKAGLQEDDVIVRYDGQTIDTANQLISLVQRTSIGKNVNIDVWRKGEITTLSATISENTFNLANSEPTGE